jgi:hypothetical protein
MPQLGGVAMTPDEQAEMNRLCRLIQVEKESKKFDQLVSQLNELLEGKGTRLIAQRPNSTPN